MIKLVLITLITLSVVYACSSSCKCFPGLNKCASCIDPNSEMDSQMASCLCKDGFYSSVINNVYTCQNIFVSDIALDVCQSVLVTQLSNVSVLTNCSTVTNSTTNDISVTSSINLDFTTICIENTCINQIFMNIRYLNIITNQYNDLPSQYVTEPKKGSKIISIPIMQFYNMTGQGNNSTKQFSNNLQLQIQIYNVNQIIRTHSYRLVLLTNSQKVQAFSFDINQQNTDGCMTQGADCVVVADVTTTGFICTDQTCNVQSLRPAYTIGDYLYGKIYFLSTNYTKTLAFTQLLLQIDAGQVVDLTSATQIKQINGGFIFKVQQIYATKLGALQVSMKINANSRLRMLQSVSSDSSDTKQKTFSLQVSNNNSTLTNSKASSCTKLLSFIGLMVISLLI